MAYDGPGLVAPQDFTIRDPRTRPQQVGRIKNPVGWMEIGGFTSASKLPEHDTPNQRVEAPTGVRSSVGSAQGGGGMRRTKKS